MQAISPPINWIYRNIWIFEVVWILLTTVFPPWSGQEYQLLEKPLEANMSRPSTYSVITSLKIDLWGQKLIQILRRIELRDYPILHQLLPHPKWKKVRKKAEEQYWNSL